MKSSCRKNSELVQQLCKHISKLEETTLKLHQRIAQFDNEKQQVIKYLSESSWQSLLKKCIQHNNQKYPTQTDSSKIYAKDNNSPNGLKKTGFNFGQQSNYRQIQSSSNSYTSNISRNTQNFHTSIIDKITKLEQQKQMPAIYHQHNYHHQHSNNNAGINSRKKRWQKMAQALKQIIPVNNNNHISSACQSPIQSESRIINKSIRGDTRREQQYQQQQEFSDNYYDTQTLDNFNIADNNKLRQTSQSTMIYAQQIKLINNQQNTDDKQNINYFINHRQNHTKPTYHTVSLNRNIYSQAVDNSQSEYQQNQYDNQQYNNQLLDDYVYENGDTETEMNILSIENTRLRQRNKKLQAIIASMDLRQQFYL